MLGDSMMLGGGRKAAPYSIENSLLCGGTRYLTRTFSTPTNRDVWTYSGWIRRSQLVPGSYVNLMSSPVVNGQNNLVIYLFYDAIKVEYGVTGVGGSLLTGPLMRDLTGWYHIVVAVDLTQSIAANRIQVYVNGVAVTLALSPSGSYPSQSDWKFNTAGVHTLAAEQNGSSVYAQFPGYMADIAFVDGAALLPDRFGETDPVTGSWRPKAITGITWGNNGFHLGKPWSSRLSLENAFSFSSGIDGGLNSANYTVRTVFSPVALSNKSGKKVRVRFDASGLGYTIGAAYIGKRAASGNAWDFDGNQVRLKFNGMNAGNVGANSYIYSDFAAIDIDGRSDYIIAIDYGSNASNVYGSGTMPSTVTSYYKASGSEAGTTAPSGYATPGHMRAITRIEVVPDIHMGSDYSGQGNDWTSVNFVGTDVVSDSPTNVYAVLNPLLKASGAVLSEGNLKFENAGGNYGRCGFTFGLPFTGKWFSGEIQPTTTCDSTHAVEVGVALPSANLMETTGAGLANTYGLYSSGTRYKSVNGTVTIVGGAVLNTSNVLRVLADVDAGKVWIGIDGAWLDSTFGTTGNPEAGTNPTFTFAAGQLAGATFYVCGYANGVTLNCGQRAMALTPPAGFKPLSTANMPATTGQTSGSFIGNANADGPCVYTGAVPLTLSINGNAVTWGTHADKLATGFKIRTASTSYNASASNTWTATYASPQKPTVGPKGRAPANAQGN